MIYKKCDLELATSKYTLDTKLMQFLIQFHLHCQQNVKIWPNTRMKKRLQLKIALLDVYMYDEWGEKATLFSALPDAGNLGFFMRAVM